MGHRLRPNAPALYHGTAASRPYFEGWYFRHVSGKGDVFCVIPGIFRGTDETRDTAFIQVIFVSPPESDFIEYPADTFAISEDKFELWIGNSVFSQDKMMLDIGEPRITASLNYAGITPLHTNVVSPSIMGPFSYLPGMQCNHGVLSLTHTVSGTANIKGQMMDFNDAHGYIEKDWGEAFPERWIWMQCNDRDASLMCAVATIPYGPFHFTGVICVLLCGGRQYRMATYNGAKLADISIDGPHVTAQIRRYGYRLFIRASAGAFGTLRAPTKDGMTRSISECIDATYHIELYHGKTLVFMRDMAGGGLELLDAEKLAGRKTTL